MSDGIHVTSGGGMSFNGHAAVSLYRASVLKSALYLYLKTGIKPNRAYTPTNMLAAVSALTGKSYPRGKAGMGRAINDLVEWIERARQSVPVTREGE